MRGSLRKAKGLALIELTLMMGMFVGAVAIIADLYTVSQLRSHYDRMSHNLASIISIQRYISAKDLNLLIARNMPEADIGEYELYIYNVKLDRSMAWRPLRRGALDGICPELSTGKNFSADMPEEDSEDDQNAVIVVQLCRQSEGLTPFASLLSPKTIQVVASNRAREKTIHVDKVLAGELGIDEDDDSSS